MYTETDRTNSVTSAADAGAKRMKCMRSAVKCSHRAATCYSKMSDATRSSSQKREILCWMKKRLNANTQPVGKTTDHRHRQGSDDLTRRLQEKSMNPFCVSFGSDCIIVVIVRLQNGTISQFLDNDRTFSLGSPLVHQH